MRKLVYILIVLAAAAYILLRPVNEAVVRDNQVKLSAAVTPVATPTPVPTPTPTPTPVPTPTPTPTPTPFMISVNSLYEGLSDTKGSNEIARLQNCLEEKGYYKGAVDGTYGAATADAVRYFQSVNGLPVTGVADAVTIYAVYSDECIVDPAPSPTPFVNGVKGEEVIALQERLRLFGFLGSDADGAFGAKTETAVLMAQEYLHALEQQKASVEVTPVPTPTAVWMTPTPTPMVTPQNVLDESIGAYVDLPTPSPTPTIRFTPTPAPWTADGTVTEEFVEKLNDDNFVYYVSDVKNGDKTDEAKRIQNRLVVLGYMKKSDGVFGSGTERALMYFQYRNGLPETGIADLQTQSRLYSVDAKTSDTIVTQYKITVSTSKQRTYVYKWNGRSFDTTPVKTFKCSTGLNATPTPKGEFWVTGPTGSRWHYFKDFDCYAQWAWVIEGGQGILFHSVIYSTPNENSLRRGTVSQLGSKASHGCVRLSVADAKWIYDNCASGTPVTVE